MRIRGDAEIANIRGGDLEGWRRLIADKRPGDRYYIVEDRRPSISEALRDIGLGDPRR